MLVSLKWLNEFIRWSDEPVALAARLTMAGIEVEGVHKPGSNNAGVLVAEVRAAEPIPGKSLLRCMVFDGIERQVVCGDTSIKVGERVTYAPPGSRVNGRDMGSRSFGDVASAGMLCSLADLGLESKSTGVLRLEAEPGTALGNVIDLADQIWELNITPNRADCLSHWGVARELGAIVKVPAKYPRVRVPEKGAPIPASVEIQDEKGCALYTCRVIRGVKVQPSPLDVRLRLEACGQRPINNVVDATNLALLELGQPLHAFDLAKLAGGRIVVRRAKASEKITLIDGKERELSPDDLVIADAEKPIALAGVMGGAGSEVTDTTVDILLESAYFDPVSVRKSAKRHGLHTEASHRFERRVDPAGVPAALDRCAALIVAWSGGKSEQGIVSAGAGVAAPEAIALRRARIGRILGVDVPPSEAKSILTRIGCHLTRTATGWTVVPPNWRGDLTAEIDLIEEIARLYGYDRVPAAPPSGVIAAAPPATTGHSQAARTWLHDTGFHEAVTYSFTTPDFVRALKLPQGDDRSKPLLVGNPLTVEQSAMRTLLLPSLLEAASLNLRRGNLPLRLFDVARVFIPGATLADHVEPVRACAVAFGSWDDSMWGEKARPVDFFDMKGVLEGLLAKLGYAAEYVVSVEPFLHPGIAASILVGGKTAGWIGALHPEVARNLDIAAGIAFELDLDSLPRVQRARPVAPSKFPAVMRDVAFLVDRGTSAAAIERALRSAAPDELESISLFDYYAGESLGGRVNVAFHLRFQAADRTLVDDEIDRAVTAMAKAVADQVNGELRSH